MDELLKPFQRGSKLFNNVDTVTLSDIVKGIFNLVNTNDTLLNKGIFCNFYLTDYFYFKEQESKNLGISGVVPDSTIICNDTLTLHLNETFVPYLHAPKSMQEYLWGDMMLKVAELFPEVIDEQSFKVFKYFFPKSFFLESLISKYHLTYNKNKIKSDNFTNSEIHFIDTLQKINTLDELLKSYFSGKYVFIDLWASWCAPCKQEFGYTNLIDTFFSKMNIKRLYISIDNPVAKDSWISDINFYNLSGFHIMANDKLVDDLKEKIFQKSIFSIPRYILIDKSGKVIMPDAPRISSTTKLKELIKKYLKE